MEDNLQMIRAEVIKLEKYIKKFDNIDIDKLKNDKEYRTKIHTPIIEKLQKINECFLQNYIIKINDLKIYPVEVEIYYYNSNGIFSDGNCHQNELQQYKVKNKDGEEIFRFGKLYFHRRGKFKKHNISICSGGFDVCVANSDGYFLSILIRSAYFNENIDTLKEGIGINNIVKKILLNNNEKKYKSIIEKMRKHQKLENKEKEDIQKDLKNLEKTINIEERNDNNQLRKCEIIPHYRIQNKKYFNHNKKEKKDYDKYKLNSFINDAEIIKEIYKDKHEEIKNNLKNKGCL